MSTSSAIEVDRLLHAVEDEEARRSLHAFVKLYWSVIESAPFVDNWHIHAVCEHLEAVTRGQINNLLINIPPGCAKSLLVSVFWPAWEWATNGNHKYFGASYSEPLAIRDAMRCRDIITSERYQRAYPHIQIRRDANGKEHYKLTIGGERIATSVGGRGTGLHPTRKIVDDPHTVNEAESEAKREEAVNWFKTTLPSRGLGLGAATVVVMQRLHQKDVAGAIIESEDYKNWEHLVLPMEHEPQRICKFSTLGFKDQRKTEGELLWPALFDRKKVETLKISLGDYGSSGQLQQRPSPAGGGILRPEHLKLWPAKDDLPDLLFIVQSYDTAYTDKTQNDPTANTTWGIFQQGKKRCALLLESWAEFLTYPKLRQRLLDDWKAEYGGIQGNPMHPSRRADVVLIEEKGSGQSVRQDLQAANVPVHGYNPGRADKTARAHMTAPLLETGCFYVLESKKDPGQPIRWARPLLKQMEEFPNGEHDDLVDTLTQGAIYLRDANLLTLTIVEDEQPKDIDYHERKRPAKKNPYFA